jgi:hypothetical protein
MAISSTPIARGAGHLQLHVDPVEVLDRAVVETLRLGHGRVGPLAAERAHLHREALREAWVRRQPVETLYEHVPAPRAVDPKSLELDVDAEPASEKRARSDVGLCMRRLCTRTCTSFKRGRTPETPP